MSLLVSRPGVYLLLSISLLLSPGSLQAEDRRLDIAWETFQFMTSMPPASELEGKFAQYVYRLDGKRSGTKFLLDNLGEFSGAAALEIILIDGASERTHLAMLSHEYKKRYGRILLDKDGEFDFAQAMQRWSNWRRVTETGFIAFIVVQNNLGFRKPIFLGFCPVDEGWKICLADD